LNIYFNHVLQLKSKTQKKTTKVDGSTAALQGRHTINTKRRETRVRRNWV